MDGRWAGDGCWRRSLVKDAERGAPDAGKRPVARARTWKPSQSSGSMRQASWGGKTAL